MNEEEQQEEVTPADTPLGQHIREVFDRMPAEERDKLVRLLNGDQG